MQNTDSQNLATQSRWMAILPVNQIFPSERKSLSLNLTKFTLPEVTIGSNEVRYQGSFMEVPSRIIDPASKTLEFTYLVSSDFYQYKMLHKWAQFIAYNANQPAPPDVKDRAENLLNYAFPVTIILLSEYKKPLISIRYNNCWIKNFGPLSMDYQANDEPVIHTFAMSYSNFEFIDVLDPSILV